MKYKEILKRNDIKYIIYVDASGDDGFDFRDSKGDGSSPCYTVAAFLTAVEDIPHNISVLNNAKKIFGHKDEKSELKYTKVRRHFKSVEIHNELLDNLKGTLVIQNAFKKYHVMPSNKPSLTGLCHSLSIALLSSSYETTLDNVCVVIDHMKAYEEAYVIDAFKNFEEQRVLESHICYMDSKDKDASLIQVADFFAGMYRNFFEEIYTDEVIFNKLLHACPPCKKLLHGYPAQKLKSKCLFDKRKIKIPYANYIKKSTRLLKKEKSYHFAVPTGVYTMPNHLWPILSFIDCKLNADFQKTRK